MSQLDLVAELKAARMAAPPEVRERVRLIAAADTTGRRTFTWQRALVVAVPVAAAVAASIVFTRPGHHGGTNDAALRAEVHGAAAQPPEKSLPTFRAASTPQVLSGVTGAPTVTIPGSRTRVQQYGALLALHVASPAGVSDGVKRALRTVGSFGGYPVSVHVSTQRHAASADLVLKVPRTHIQQAIGRLGQIGTIVGEQLDVQDLQTGINATDRTIEQLQRTLRTLRKQPQTDAVKRQIVALTARVERLQRARAATIRAARFATVQLSLSTVAPAQPKHHGHGPLHGLGIAFRWIGIGLVYAVALGAPAGLLAAAVWLAVRAVRRRRVDALLSRP